MATLSHPHPFLLRGKPASLVVHWNDSYCWGVVTRTDGTTFEVMSNDEDNDLYDLPLTECIETMVSLANSHKDIAKAAIAKATGSAS